MEQRLRALAPAALSEIRRGVEKESLRVTPDGHLALTPHAPGLGSPLTHPHITTDFSEAQLELITGVHPSAEACIAELTRIHQTVYRHIDDEVLWCASMPCRLPDDDAIPIAQYGRSNIARMKTVYRLGLAHRYGRRMQTISGVHYNWSLPQTAWPVLGMHPNDGYFALIRNFRRLSWLLLYLFGASPAVCASFVEGRAHELEALSPATRYLPYATSLRMGRLGYQSEAQSALAVSYNSLERYAASLEHALTQPYAPYEAIGIHDGDEYRQLTTTLLQIENEFYGTIRPKRPIRRGERALHALRERGVEYVEVRLLDLDPYSAVGITPDAMRFLDVFLLYCLLAESPPDTDEEIAAVGSNQHLVSRRGREPGLLLMRDGSTIALTAWAREVIEHCRPVAAALDETVGPGHGEALAAAERALQHPALTPSARVLDEMAREHENSYARFALAQSLRHAGTLRSAGSDPEAERMFEQLAAQSVSEQREIEAADMLTFDAYRQQYLAPERLRP